MSMSLYDDVMEVDLTLSDNDDTDDDDRVVEINTVHDSDETIYDSDSGDDAVLVDARSQSSSRLQPNRVPEQQQNEDSDETISLFGDDDDTGDDEVLEVPGTASQNTVQSNQVERASPIPPSVSQSVITENNPSQSQDESQSVLQETERPSTSTQSVNRRESHEHFSYHLQIGNTYPEFQSPLMVSVGNRSANTSLQMPVVNPSANASFQTSGQNRTVSTTNSIQVPVAFQLANTSLAAVNPSTSVRVPVVIPSAGVGVPGLDPSASVLRVNPSTSVNLPRGNSSASVNLPRGNSSASITLPGGNSFPSVSMPGVNPSAAITLPGENPSTSFSLPRVNPSASVSMPGVNPSASVGVLGVNPSARITVPGLNPFSNVTLPGVNPSAGVSWAAVNPYSSVSLPGANISASISFPGVNPSRIVTLPGLNPSPIATLPGVNPSPIATLPGVNSLSSVTLAGVNPSPIATSAGVNPSPIATLAGVNPSPIATLAGVNPSPIATLPGVNSLSSVTLAGVNPSPSVTLSRVNPSPSFTLPGVNPSPIVTLPGVNSMSSVTLAGVNPSPSVTLSRVNSSPSFTLPGVNPSPIVTLPGVNSLSSVTLAGVNPSPSVTLSGVNLSPSFTLPGVNPSPIATLPLVNTTSAVTLPGVNPSPHVTLPEVNPPGNASSQAQTENQSANSNISLLQTSFQSPSDFKQVNSSKKVLSPERDDEAECCPICFENWTNSGAHRLASLKCGHLFGQSCIMKWLKGRGGKCPQCNAKSKKSEIRVIYAKAVRTMDTAERDRALKDLEMEKEVRRKSELEAAQLKMQYQLAMDECNRLKAQLHSQDRVGMAGPSTYTGASCSGISSSSQPSHKGGAYKLDKTIHISPNGGCRVMAYNPTQYALVLSMPSPNQLFPGHGIKKLSMMDMKSNQYVTIHSKMLRDCCFNNRQDGLLLTASVDKTIKITSLLSNTVVQTYACQVPVWSCAWNLDDTNYVYAGLQNGSIVMYDTRNTLTQVAQFNRDGSRCPIVSLQYVENDINSSFKACGLLTGSLEGVQFWEKKAAAEYKPHILPLEGSCTYVSFERTTRHCMASFRPNKNHPFIKHLMCELQSRSGDCISSSTCSSNTVQTFYGGSTMKLLTRSRLFASPLGSGQVLACAGDESSLSAHIWNGSNGNLQQKLPANSPILDACPFVLDGQHMLAIMTEKLVKIHRWT
ncbi:uncharacterized protein LOC100377562 [Saccoglossus kowalevskii]|uniref:RING-type E3 ubiquitin transferase n=1 Tax=Saccoglossus kowalevskii TaxID=10224 RepID=A0ABM0GLQ1_SACKO|nr:PREDICTED: mucin-12-like [Saccoglossus kowalevskii]